MTLHVSIAPAAHQLSSVTRLFFFSKSRYVGQMKLTHVSWYGAHQFLRPWSYHRTAKMRWAFSDAIYIGSKSRRERW